MGLAERRERHPALSLLLADRVAERAAVVLGGGGMWEDGRVRMGKDVEADGVE